jgi:hypothetical protein
LQRAGNLAPVHSFVDVVADIAFGTYRLKYGSASSPSFSVALKYLGSRKREEEEVGLNAIRRSAQNLMVSVIGHRTGMLELRAANWLL